jgi:hypothetical protein
MSNQLLASKVVVTEEAPRIRTGVSGPTAVLAALGQTERGPFEPTLVTSFEEFANTYGDAFSGSKFPLAIEGFFENGGNFLYVKRVDKTGSAAASGTLLTANTGPTAGTVLASLSGPYSLDPGDDLQVDIDAVGAATATFNATAGSAVTTGGAFPIAMVMDETLEVSIDGGPTQSVTVLVTEVTSGAATATEIAASLNVKLTGCSVQESGGEVLITSDVKGTSSSVAVTGGTLIALTGAFTPTAGTGNVADISMVTASEIETVVEAAVAGCDVTIEGGAPRITSSTTGASSSVQVLSASTADTKIGFDNVLHAGGTGAPVTTVNLAGKTSGTYANSLTVEIADATSGDTDSFNLFVKSGSVVLETFPNLNMYPSSDNYIETVVNDTANGSLYISATDAAAPRTPPDNRPANVAAATLSGGVNPNPGDAEYVDALTELDTIEGITLLAAPDRPTATVQQALLQYAETTRQGSMFCVLDPPENKSATEIIEYVETTATLLNSSEFGAIYWPEIKVQNDYKDLYGSDATVTIPPSGHICGMIARTDSASDGGIYQPPAGIERGVLFGVRGFGTEEVKDEAKRDLVYPKRINPITSYNGQRPFVDGTRTLKADGNFPSVAERRGVSYIEGQVKNRIQFARHSNNNPALRAAVTRTTEAFLLGELGKGAFRSNIPDQAFFVDFGDGLNPESVQFAGKLVGRIGLATNKPADFIILKFSQDTRALEDELANAGL